MLVCEVDTALKGGTCRRRFYRGFGEGCRSPPQAECSGARAAPSGNSHGFRTPGAASRVPGAIVRQMAIVRRNRPKTSARLVRGDLGQLQVAPCSAKLESSRICCTLRCTDIVRIDSPSGNPAGSRSAARTILSRAITGQIGSCCRCRSRAAAFAWRADLRAVPAVRFGRFH